MQDRSRSAAVSAALRFAPLLFGDELRAEVTAIRPPPAASPPRELEAPTVSAEAELAIEVDPIDYMLLRAGASLEFGSGAHALKASAYVLDDFKSLSSYELEYRYYFRHRLFSGPFVGFAGFTKSVDYLGQAPWDGGPTVFAHTTARTIGLGFDVGYGWRWDSIFLTCGGGLEAFALLGHPFRDENEGEHFNSILFAHSAVFPRAVLTFGYVL